MPPPAKPLSLDEARAAIRDVTSAFNTPENLQKMIKARTEAGNDLMKMMQIVLPVAMQIQQAVITKYGFEANQQGVMMFASAIRAHESDPEIAQLAKFLKDQFMPQPNPVS